MNELNDYIGKRVSVTSYVTTRNYPAFYFRVTGILQHDDYGYYVLDDNMNTVGFQNSMVVKIIKEYPCDAIIAIKGE